MSLPREFGRDDQELVRYLLKLLPDEDAERLDEASIDDDEVAARLRIVEDDLVDAYVSGALTGVMLEQFESCYLLSPRRRENVRFARSFRRAVDRAVVSAGTDTGQDLAPAFLSDEDEAPRSGPAPRDRMTFRALRRSPLAALAAVLAIACGTLFFAAMRLRNGLTVAHRESVELDRRTRDLARQLDDQRAANAAVVKELERVRESAARAPQSASAAPLARAEAAGNVAPLAFVLLPQTRATDQMSTFAVPQGGDRVVFELRLDSSDSRRYQVGLKDPATLRIVWRSGWIAARPSGDRASVSVGVPASLLKPQHYSFDLTSRDNAGTAEVVGSYAFEISR
jgi:hypothetical protein